MFYSVFMFLLCFLDNSQKKLIIVCPPCEKITQFVSFDVLGAFRVRKGFLISAHFHQNMKISVTALLTSHWGIDQ